MMGLDERFAYLLVGCLIGFVLGYMARSIRNIEKKVDTVVEIEKHRDERGISTYQFVANVALAFVVVLVVVNSFRTGSTNEVLKSTQDDIKQTQQCTQSYLAKTITALNERTTYSQAQSMANVELQRAQAEFITSALQEPPLEKDRVEAGLRKYFDKVTAYVTLVGKTAGKQATNPYPTEEQFVSCINGDEEIP